MSRIRTIKPEFWRNEALSELPEFTHMLAAALLNYADDEGYFNANARLVLAECFPLREPSVSVPVALQELSRAGFITLGEGQDGRLYGHIVAFAKHQVINRPTKSKIASLSIAWGKSLKPHGVISEPSVAEGNREQGREVEREDAEAIASDGQAVAGQDFAKAVWEEGVRFLTLHGKTPNTARTMIGRWRKEHPDTEIFDAFAACGKAGVVDPIPWITARLGKPKSNQDMLNKVFADMLKGPTQ